MAVREIKYTVYPSGIYPQTVQRGGLQGEHNGCKVIFAFSDELVTKLQKEITDDTKLYYRFDVYDGAGGYNPYETSELSLSNGMALEHELDQSITVAGGTVKVYLIISKLNGDIESEMIMYTYPAELGFEKTSNGTEEYTVRDMNAAAVAAKKAAEAAEAAKKASALSEENAEKYADEIKALTNKALKAAEAVKGFVEDIDKSLSYKANKDDLRCKVRKFVGITTTPIYNSMVGNTIVLLDGSTYVAEQGDVVFGSSEPRDNIESGDINKDGYVDADDKNAVYDKQYDLNGDGSFTASDYALAKLMVAAGYSYFIYDGEEWRDYTVIADIHYKPDSINPQSGIAVEQVAAELRNMIGDKVNTADMYTEEQAGCQSKGTFCYFENAKGETNVEITAESYGDYDLTICGANIVKPIETTEIGGVTFNKCDDGGISIVGTATESSFVPVTDIFCSYGMSSDLMVSGKGLYFAFANGNSIVPFVLLENEGYLIKHGDSISSDDQGFYKLAFKIESGKSYNINVYPMVTLGAGKKQFEPYKDYGTLRLPEPPETITFTFPEDDDYYIFEIYGECPFVCSDYTKKTANYIPEADRGNFVTVDELANEINEVKSYIDETFLGGSW